MQAQMQMQAQQAKSQGEMQKIQMESQAKIQYRQADVAFEIEKIPTGKRVCDGYSDYSLVSLANGRATPLPEDIKAKYSI